MIAVEGTYHDGKVKLLKKIKTKKPVKVIVTFLNDEELASEQKLTREKFNFDKTRELLKNVKSSLSDAVIEERRLEV